MVISVKDLGALFNTLASFSVDLALSSTNGAGLGHLGPHPHPV